MIVPFRPRVPLITLKFTVIGWDVVHIDPCGSRTILDESFGVVEPAVSYGQDVARRTGCSFVAGAARRHWTPERDGRPRHA